MPPKAAAGRRGKGSVAVGLNHPANVAVARKKANAARAAPTRESPRREAKTVATDRIAAQLSPLERVPVASVAPHDAAIETTVVVLHEANKSPDDDPPPAKKLSIPPLWNAWYSTCCQALRFVGDGGALSGSCTMCGDECPGRKDVMLDPEQLSELERTPLLAYDALTGTTKSMSDRPPSRVLPISYPRGRPRNSPQKFQDIRESSVAAAKKISSCVGVAEYSSDEDDEDDDGSAESFSSPRASGDKTAGMSSADEDLGLSPDSAFSHSVLRDSPPTPTDNEVSRFSFCDRLKHYMDGNLITKANRTSVEMCILVEAGAAVRGMDPMKKEKKERIYFNKYMLTIDEIEDSMFSHPHLRDSMRMRYKNAKKDNTGTSLWRKYDAELRELRNFATKIPGVSSLAELPSGFNQLRHMKMPQV